MFLIIIVPPEDVNGDLANMAAITDQITALFASFGLAVYIEVVTGAPKDAA